jgi:hypothetical protein
VGTTTEVGRSSALTFAAIGFPALELAGAATAFKAAGFEFGPFEAETDALWHPSRLINAQAASRIFPVGIGNTFRLFPSTD